MDPLNNIFAEGACIVTKNINGKTKVALCKGDESNPFDQSSSDKWITLNESVKNAQDQSVDKTKDTRVLKPLFNKIGIKNNQHRLGCYLIRDLLNFKKQNSLTEAFMADNIPLLKVVVCARITSYEQKNNFYRVILDDSTSSILCMIKVNGDNNFVPEQSHYIDGIDTSFDEINNDVDSKSSTFWAIKSLELQSKNLTEQSLIHFDRTSLGRPVQIIGFLREFCGKNYIYAFKLKWITEEYFINFLGCSVCTYEYKENYMFEEKNIV